LTKIIACAVLLFSLAQSTPEPIQVSIGKGKELTVKVPNIAKDDLAGIISTFFSRGDREAEKKFNGLLSESPSLTLILTTDKTVAK
jgi:hypothetical protein